MKFKLAFILLIASQLLVSCAVKCPPDNRPVKFGREPNHKFAIKGVEANLKAIVDATKQVTGEASFKQTVFEIVKPLENKAVVIGTSIDNAYRLAKNDPCNQAKFDGYKEMVAKGLKEYEVTEELREKITSQLKSSGLSGGTVTSIKQLIKDYNNETSFPTSN